MAKAKFDIPSQLPESITRPLYAGVGVTDRVVGAVRETVADVTKTVAGLDYQPQALRRQATQAAGDTLALLVRRGETLVGRIRGQAATTQTVEAARTTVAKAKTTRTQAKKKTPARSSAKATTTSAKKTASSAARATKAAAKKVGD